MRRLFPVGASMSTAELFTTISFVFCDVFPFNLTEEILVLGTCLIHKAFYGINKGTNQDQSYNQLPASVIPVHTQSWLSLSMNFIFFSFFLSSRRDEW